MTRGNTETVFVDKSCTAIASLEQACQPRERDGDQRDTDPARGTRMFKVHREA